MPFRKKVLPPARSNKKDGNLIIKKKKKVKKLTTKPNNKLTKKGEKKWYCCSLYDLLGVDIKKTRYEIVNIVDENSIYSPEHEIENKEFGLRIGQIYVKSDLDEQMFVEGDKTI